jgi:NaMN:DMB phosphoribosyltransferase
MTAGRNGGYGQTKVADVNLSVSPGSALATERALSEGDSKPVLYQGRARTSTYNRLLFSLSGCIKRYLGTSSHVD